MDEPQSIDNLRVDIMSKIFKYGLCILHIFGDIEQGVYTYSIAIEGITDSPDIVLSGVDASSGKIIINSYFARLKKGETFECDKRYDDFVFGYDIIFKPVLKKHNHNFSGLVWFSMNRQDFNMVQMVCPDKSGKFPWEKGYSKKMMKAQQLFF